MSNAKSTSRSIYIDSSSAQSELDKLTKKMNTLQASINGGTLASDKLNKKIKELANTKADIQKVQDQIDKGLKPTFVQVQNQVSQLRNELKRMSEDSPGFAAKFDAYKKASATLSDMKTKIDGVKESQSGFAKITEHVFEAFAAYRIVEVAFEKVKEFFTGSIEEAEKAEKANTRLKNILENIGRLDAFDRLKQKAGDLAAQFKFLDNDDLIEVEQKLVTYGKLTEGQINQLLPVIINFASKSGISLEESASTIIKSLEGNAKALKEYGISMKDGADVTERMNILMKELAPRVEGAADAFGESMSGKAAEAKQHLADLEEEVGNKLIPVLTKLYSWASDAITGLVTFGKTIKNVFSTGNILDGVAMVRGEAVANQINEANKSAAASILLRVQDASIDDKKKYLVELNQKVLEYEGQLLIAKNNHNAEMVKNLSETIGGFKIARDQLDNDIKAASDKTILGAGGDDGPTKEEIKKAEEARQKALKAWNELIAKIQDGLNKAMQDPYIYELNKILAERISQIKQVIDLGKEAGKTPAQIQSAIDLVNKATQQKTFQLGVDAIAATHREINNTKLDHPVETITSNHLDFLNDPNLDLIGPDAKAREKGREEDLAAEKKAQQQSLENTVQYANQVVDIYSTIANFKTNQENAAFAKEVKLNDQRKRSLQAMLNAKIINQVQYNNQVQKLDDALEKKKEDLERKQFRRNQVTSIAQTLMAGAEGEIKLWANPGFPAAIPMAIALGAETVAKAAFIAAQKPQFAKGGVLTGDSHASGGMPVINRRTGQVEAEVEGGEVILSKNTVRNNWDLINPLLQSSMNQGGRRINPFWLTRSYQPINYPAIQNTFTQRRFFANGGVFPGADPTGNSQHITNNQPVILHDDETKAVLFAILNRLNNPVAPEISLKKIDKVRDQQGRINNDAAFK